MRKIMNSILITIIAVLVIILINIILYTYKIDSVTKYNMNICEDLDPTSIREISDEYIYSLNINTSISINIEYRYVEFKDLDEDNVILGTFHKWNNTYYIDISKDLASNDIDKLRETVIHETRHMLVQYLKDEKIIDLTAYTEEIATQKNEYYNNLFNSGIYLLDNK